MKGAAKIALKCVNSLPEFLFWKEGQRGSPKDTG